MKCLICNKEVHVLSYTNLNKDACYDCVSKLKLNIKEFPNMRKENKGKCDFLEDYGKIFSDVGEMD